MKENKKEEFISAEDITVKEETIAHKEKREKAVEETGMRERCSTVYRLKGDRRQKRIYAHPVYEYDDEACELVESSGIELSIEDGGKHYANRKGDFKARFSRDISDEELFSVEKDGYKLSFLCADGKKKLSSKLVERPDMIDNAVIFEDAAEDTDIQYELMESRVKENIIIKKPGASGRFKFKVVAVGLRMQMDIETKEIKFFSKETNEEIFCVPAPFMKDAAGEFSGKVSYETKAEADGSITLSVIADKKWLGCAKRSYPVVIDPQINVSGLSTINTYTFKDGYMYQENTSNTISTGENGDPRRMYIHFEMPSLPKHSKLEKMELKLAQVNGIIGGTKAPKIGIYSTSSITSGACTPTDSTELIDYAVMKSGKKDDETNEDITYTFDLTSYYSALHMHSLSVCDLVLKMVDETTTDKNTVTLYGAGAGSDFIPQILVTYKSSFGINDGSVVHTHDIGRFGKGMIDIRNGNLMFESEDFSFESQNMPIDIRHIYNGALCENNYTGNSTIGLNVANYAGMRFGAGFRINYMQSMISKEYPLDDGSGISYDYVYSDGDGNEHRFVKNEANVLCDGNNCYALYEDVDDNSITYDHINHTMKKGEDTYTFDVRGRLVKISDKYGNYILITYSVTSNDDLTSQIMSIENNTGKKFTFAYSNKYLSSITSPGGAVISYTYTDNYLTGVTYPDGRSAVITYSNTSNKPSSILLKDSSGNSVYSVSYVYSGYYYESVWGVTEHGYNGTESVLGQSARYSYDASGRESSVLTSDSTGESTLTKYVFDADGNVISCCTTTSDDKSALSNGMQSSGMIDPYLNDGAMGIVSNINNLIVNHTFATLNGWSGENANTESRIAVKSVFANRPDSFGERNLSIETKTTSIADLGVYYETETMPKGDYTFSCYVDLGEDIEASGMASKGVFLKVTDESGAVLGESEHIFAKSDDLIRLVLPFAIESAKKLRLHIMVNGKAHIYVSGAQLEDNVFAGAYNIVTNGNFELGNDGWTMDDGAVIDSTTSFNMSKSLKITGDLNKTIKIKQAIPVKTALRTRESFTLSGWAKGKGLPTHDDKDKGPLYRLRAMITYVDGTTEDHVADFAAGVSDWQFASVSFAKDEFKAIEKLELLCEYGNNTGTVYFDDIQLIRDEIELGLAAEEFSRTPAESDEELDSIASESGSALQFEEAKDAFGNAITQTTFADGELGTMYRAYEYDEFGNQLVLEIDERGNEKAYTYEDTALLDEFVESTGYFESCSERDENGRVVEMTSGNYYGDDDEKATVSYCYDDFDNVTQIMRDDDMTYNIGYNEFHKLSSIGIYGIANPLVQYTYKEKNGRLKEVTYANGSVMKLTYNTLGQIVSEKWFASAAATSPEASYKYFYDSFGNIVKTVDNCQNKEYTYIYERGMITRITEADVIFGSDGVTVISRTIKNSITYSYNAKDELVKKQLSDGIVYNYSYPENENPSVSIAIGEKNIISRSKTDGFGRKVFDELQLGKSFMSRQFGYCSGVVSANHLADKKVRSTPTTNLVNKITFANGRTISYVYDDGNRIVQVNDSLTGMTAYTYDACGQLLSETNGTQTVNVTYDKCGNILTRGGNTYTYGNGTWKDLLTAFNGMPITYDAQGNPIDYLGHTLVWEKGRQLKAYDSNIYTYNASGIRTSKTISGVKHTFTLDGTKILKEAWGTNELIPIYDNEDSVCGIVYNDVPYYFYKNLQGDIIEIADENGITKARYSYDAWGICTICSDTSGKNIAAINPFRYRSYYFDIETNLYYLQSRYYNPLVGRFLNGDEQFDEMSRLLGYNLFSYCGNNPVLYFDILGYGKTYVIYYNRSGNGFYEQAYNSPYYNIQNKNVQLISVLTVNGFINIWNSMKEPIDYIYLYLHGGPGVLYFKGESLGFSGYKSFKKLLSKKVNYGVYLFSCKGGYGNEGSNVAWMFAKLTDSPVYACTGSVSFSKIFGKYYARKALDWGVFKTFYYERRFIFWGPIVAKNF